MLSNLFVEFDKQCYNHGLYKLYTIGDCYVCMGFNDARQRNPGREAMNTVQFGFKLIEIIKKVRKIIKFEGLDMRIGIHTGKLIGGIIGTDIVRYDVYGPDVVIANKMESNGKEGEVQVSATTKELLEKYCPWMYRFEKFSEVETKFFEHKVPGYLIKKAIED
eukprot:TRINITY_DN7210_c0_g2_i3.p1 TRINITY_DN7210_c0_g2~~TRINITY_DN7210_c0_g2_i3.p1  ORF type:complete len:163 (-),score=19.79 TRINITY_DN7210_c0_g2_i3:66-554(-)